MVLLLPICEVTRSICYCLLAFAIAYLLLPIGYHGIAINIDIAEVTRYELGRSFPKMCA